MKKLTALAATAAVSFSGAALAADDGPQWTYVQAQYNNYDSGDDDIEGYGLAASLGLFELFHVALDYNDNTADNGVAPGVDLDWDSIQLNIGVHPAITDSTDMVAEIQYIDLSTSIGNGFTEPEADAIGARIGMRQLLGDKVEFGIYGNYWTGDVDPKDGSADEDFNDWGLEVSGRYFILEPLSIGLTLFINDPVASAVASGGDSATLDVRWGFGELF